MCMSSKQLPEKSWSHSPSVEKLPQLCGLVGFESYLKRRAQLLLVTHRPKACVGFQQAGRAAGRWTGWVWHILGGCTVGSWRLWCWMPFQQGSCSRNCICFTGQEVRDHHPVLQLPVASAQGPVVRAGLYPGLEADVCS